MYTESLTTFKTDAVAGPVTTVPVMEQGRAALEAISHVRTFLTLSQLQYGPRLLAGRRVTRDPENTCFGG